MLRIVNRMARLYMPLLVVVSSVITASPSAHGSSISFVNLFKNISYQQTGNGNSLSLNGTFFSADLFTNTANPYTSATVTLPGGSSIPLPQNSSTDYGFQTFLLPDQATMDAMFPFGTYTFTGNGAQTDVATANYNVDDYSQTLPYLTGTNFSSLQGLNASHSFTFGISPFVPGGNQTDAFVFLTIFDQFGNVAFTQGFLPSSTTSITMPGGTLAPGMTYAYELDFSDRDIGRALNGGDFPPQIGFDLRTDGIFTTAAATTPEPSSLMLLGTGVLAGIAGIRRRRA